MPPGGPTDRRLRRRVALALPVPVLAAAILTVLVVDVTLKLVEFPTPVLAAVDWSAHLATTVLILAGVQPVLRRPVFLAAVATNVLIDLDHLPQYLGSDVLTHGTFRPYPHSLATVVVLLALARAWRRGRRVALGAAIGVIAHIWRDLASGGVPLLWPFSTGTARTPYALYAGALAVLVVVAEWRGRRLRGARPAPG